MKKTRRSIFFLLLVIAAVLSVFTPGEIFVAAPAARREDEELRRSSAEVNPSGGILQSLADLATGYTVKDGTSPTRMMKSSSSGPGAGLGLCADPLAAFMTADNMAKMTDTGPDSKVASLILADQFSKDAFQSKNSTLDMSGGTRPSRSALNYDALEKAYLLSGQAEEDERGRPIPTVETQSDQWQIRQ